MWRRWCLSDALADLNLHPPSLLQTWTFVLEYLPQFDNMTSNTPKVPNYDEDIDFQALAMTDPDFAKFYDDANGHVDFHDPKALQ